MPCSCRKGLSDERTWAAILVTRMRLVGPASGRVGDGISAKPGPRCDATVALHSSTRVLKLGS